MIIDNEYFSVGKIILPLFCDSLSSILPKCFIDIEITILSFLHIRMFNIILLLDKFRCLSDELCSEVSFKSCC